MPNDLGSEIEPSDNTPGQHYVEPGSSQNTPAGANQSRREDLDTSVMSISSRYRHENQNSVYYLKPNSSEIYLLDFKLKGFCSEALR